MEQNRTAITVDPFFKRKQFPAIRYRAVAVKSLRVKNHHPARAIGGASRGEFVRCPEYTAKKQGKGLLPLTPGSRLPRYVLPADTFWKSSRFLLAATRAKPVKSAYDPVHRAMFDAIGNLVRQVGEQSLICRLGRLKRNGTFGCGNRNRFDVP